MLAFKRMFRVQLAFLSVTFYLWVVFIINLRLYSLFYACLTTKDKKATFTPNEKLWEAGVKIIADGSPHCGSAAVREPYMDTDLTQTLAFPPAPCYGKLNYTSEEMLEIVRFFHKEGTQIAVHAHGERAIDQVISAYEQVRVPQSLM